MRSAVLRSASVALIASAILVVSSPTTAQVRFRNSYDSVRVSSSYSVLTVLETATGNFAVSGGNGSNAYLIELDPSGVTNFFKTYTIFSAPALDEIAGGGYVLAGEHNSNNDPTILRVDANGDPIWSMSYDLGYSEQGFYVVHPTPDDGYLLSGIMSLKVDAAGAPLWSKIHVGGGGNVNHTMITSDGGAVLTGEGQYGNTAGDYNAVVTRMDAAGTILWNRVYAGDLYDWAAGVTPTSDGGYAVTGWTRSFTGGNQSCFLIKLDPNGTLDWANTYAGITRSECRGLRQTRDGGYVMTGASDGILLLIKTDDLGALSWARTYGLSGSLGHSVRQTVDDGFIVAGAANSNLTIIKTDASGDAATCDQVPAILNVASAMFLTGNNTTGSAQTWTPATLTATATTITPPTVRTCGSGCNATANAQISNSDVCNGEQVMLSAVGSSVDVCNVALEYRFRGSGFLRDWSIVDTATDTPTMSGSYSVDVRCLDPGCQAGSNAVSVSVHPNPLLDPGPDRTVCLTESTTLGGTPTASSGTPPYAYDWLPTPADPSMSCTTGMACDAPTATPISTTTYALIVSDNFGCMNSVQVTVTVDVPASPPDIANALLAVRGASDPTDVVFSWPFATGSAVANNLRSSDNRDFTPPNAIRATLPVTTGITLTSEVLVGTSLRLYRVTTRNCAGDESGF